MTNEQKIEAVEKWMKKAGKTDYLNFLKGERLTQRQSIKAMCYACCCGEPDICGVDYCPLLPFNRLIHHNDAPVSASTTFDRE